MKHTHIFNDMWDGICERENGAEPTNAIVDKELAISKNKDKKVCALIAAIISEEVSCHIISITDCYGALNKLKDLYDSHSELEQIQSLFKLFNLEVNDNDPMVLE